MFMQPLKTHGGSAPSAETLKKTVLQTHGGAASSTQNLKKTVFKKGSSMHLHATLGDAWQFIQG